HLRGVSRTRCQARPQAAQGNDRYSHEYRESGLSPFLWELWARLAVAEFFATTPLWTLLIGLARRHERRSRSVSLPELDPAGTDRSEVGQAG
ncbi:hypothetical protein, partial [Carbonactinospora thermoautotrophica]|uniref:hypothetical protein n=1 Tax=Carbonactinospora thermoautotrophica TaxID=1469144 RepID=UPI000AB41893